MREAILSQVIDIANAELQKTVDYLSLNEEAWNECIDFKTKDAYYSMAADDFTFELNGAKVSFDEEYIFESFNSWCSAEMDNFESYCKENGIEFNKLQDQIGRTSSFYIGHIHGECLDDILCECCNCFVESLITLNKYSIDKDKSLKAYKERADTVASYVSYDSTDDFVEDLLYLIQNVYKDVVSYMEDIIKVHTYIVHFKDTQQQSFKDFVQNCWLANII